MGFDLIKNYNCQACPLSVYRKNIVNGCGPQNAKIFIIGEGPGQSEDALGSPFIGPAGSLLKQLLHRVNIDYRQVYFSNICRCLPKSKDSKKQVRVPELEEIKKCSPFLEQEIAFIKPTVIVPAGNIALRYILQSKIANITGYRGQEIWSEKYSCKICPVIHPAAILRSPKFEGVTVEDLKRIKVASETKEIIKKNTYLTIPADTKEKVEELFSYLSTVPEVALDLETTSLDWMTGDIISVGFSWKEKEGWCLPLLKAGGDSSHFWDDKIHAYIINKLKEVMLLPSKKFGWNLKYDLKWLIYRGVQVNNVYQDGILMHSLIDDNAENLHGLKDVAWIYSEIGGYEKEVTEFFKTHKKLKKQFIYLPFEMLVKYNALDAAVTYEICKKFELMLKEQNLTRLFKQLMMPMSEVLLETEMEGVQVDKDYIGKLKVNLTTRRDAFEQEIYQTVGKKFNIDSPIKLRDILFKKLKFKPVRQTDKGAISTDKETLDTLAQTTNHPVPKLLVGYRETQKLLNTFVEGLSEYIARDGRIHATYKQHQTCTGRLSSSECNMQNIPRFDPDRPEDNIRGIFISKPGHKLIEADYKAAEARWWCEYSRDPQMLEDIQQKCDINKMTAASAFKIPLEQVTKRQRQDAKAIVYGLLYGRGTWSISQELGISEEEAKQIVRTFFGRYPKAEAWLRHQVWVAKKTGQIVNHFGRIRRLPGINSSVDFVKAESERQALNSPIQSAASDTTCAAAIRIRRKFKEMGLHGQLVITVHDSVIYEVPDEEFAISCHIIKNEAERPITGTITPMEVDLKSGTRWGVLEELKEMPKLNEAVSV